MRSPPWPAGRVCVARAPVASVDAHEDVSRVRPDRELLPGARVAAAHESGRVQSRRVYAGYLEQHRDGSRAVKSVIRGARDELIACAVAVGSVAGPRWG